jgi:hypothetical protein
LHARPCQKHQNHQTKQVGENHVTDMAPEHSLEWRYGSEGSVIAWS